MGIVNVTPDSFSDGGRFDTTEAAVAHALALLDEGAAVVDVGGESTRPGATLVDASTERDRRSGHRGHRCCPPRHDCVDRHQGRGGRGCARRRRADRERRQCVARVGHRCPRCWLDRHACRRSECDHAERSDLRRRCEEVHALLVDAVARGQAAGVEQIWSIPVWGSARLRAQPRSLANLDMFTALAPVLLGVSRKRSIGDLQSRATPPFTAVFPNPSRPTTAWRVRSPWPRGWLGGGHGPSSRCAGYRPRRGGDRTMRQVGTRDRTSPLHLGDQGQGGGVRATGWLRLSAPQFVAKKRSSGSANDLCRVAVQSNRTCTTTRRWGCPPCAVQRPVGRPVEPHPVDGHHPR